MLPSKLAVPLRLTILSGFCIVTAIIGLILVGMHFLDSRNTAEEHAAELIAINGAVADQRISALFQSASLTLTGAVNLPADTASWSDSGRLSRFIGQVIREEQAIYSIYFGFPDGGFVQALNYLDAAGNRRAFSNVPSLAISSTRVLSSKPDKNERAQSYHFFDSGGNRILGSNLDHAPAETSIYDPRVRPWYIQTREADRLTISQPYIFESLREPGITLSAPFRYDNEIIVGVDIALVELSTFVATLVPGENGRFAVMNEADKLVAHPDSTKVVEVSPSGKLIPVTGSTVEDPLLREGYLAVSRGEARSAVFEWQGDQYLAVSLPLMGLPVEDWRAISVAKLDDFTQKARAQATRSVILAVFVLLVSLVFVAFLANWVARPIVGVTEQAERISQLDLNRSLKAQSMFREVRALEQTIESMRLALQMFMRYVPQQLVRELIANQKGAEIGGSKQDITLMFTDIANFTTITEKMSPEDVLTQTSIYFDIMTEAIAEHGGTIDKFIGDAMMVMWNAPSPLDDHVAHACRAALHASRESYMLSEELVANNFQPFRTRFGLHTGDALVGNMGSQDRMQYTALGNVVNLSARLEGLNKYYGTAILVSESVQEAAGTDFVFRLVDWVQPAGTTEPIGIYELLGTRGEDSAFPVKEGRLATTETYEMAFAHYVQRSFEEAEKLFKEVLADDPKDGAAKLLLERCQRYQKNPPPMDWNGSAEFSTK
ncbi:MAG: adenylate/guanylate cyclase domain-containing protein [Magnetovibrionaceae bacterium]